jgi:SnoaL-like domain
MTRLLLLTVARLVPRFQRLAAAIDVLKKGVPERDRRSFSRRRRNGASPNEEIPMNTIQESAAIRIARAHVDAWSHHDWETARKSLSENVRVYSTTTQPIMQDTDTVGADAYMKGLEMFAQAVEPGSAKVLAATGDKHNALLFVTVRAAFAPGAPKVTLPAARLYLIDDAGKITSEKVIFYAAEA